MGDCQGAKRGEVVEGILHITAQFQMGEAFGEIGEGVLVCIREGQVGEGGGKGSLGDGNAIALSQREFCEEGRES